MLRMASISEDDFEQNKNSSTKTLAYMGTLKIKPSPFRNEWCDWTSACRHIAAIPSCGLGPIASRRPDDKDSLIGEAQQAINNLHQWIKELKSI
jgi:hypothetical protein